MRQEHFLASSCGLQDSQRDLQRGAGPARSVEWRTIVDRAEITGLGEGLEQTRRLGARSLGRTVETFTDMGKSRRLGFTGVRDTETSFTDLFARLRAEKVVP